MTFSTWGALIAAWVLAIMTPGPDIFLLLRLGIRDRGAAVRAAFGIMLGNTVWIGVSVAGLTALLSAIPGVVTAIQLAGSVVLVWIGVQSIRGGFRGLRSAEPADVSPERATRRAFALGLTTNLANPKALIFFAALFSQLLPQHAGLADRALILVVLVALGIAWFVGFALGASSSVFQRWFRRASPWIDIAAGLVFVLVAVGILLELVLVATSLR